MLYNDRNRRTHRDAARRNEAAIRGQRTPANALTTPTAVRRIRRDDRNTQPTPPAAPAQDAAPSLTATRTAFDRTRADLNVRRDSERAAVLRALGA